MVNQTRRSSLVLAAASAMLPGCASVPGPVPARSGRHFVLVHGAWHGGWAWKEVERRLQAGGHTVSAPTLSGLGERAHLAPGECGLYVHAEDVLHHLRMQDLRQVVLVGHSYAGCVLSEVLARDASRIADAVWLDAFLARRGEALASFVPPPVRQQYQQLASRRELVPPPPQPSWGERWGMTDPKLAAWAAERVTPQAALSFVEAVSGEPLESASVRLCYLKCSANPNPAFKAQGARAREHRRLRYAEVPAHHNVMVTDPDLLTRTLLELAQGV